MAIGLVLVGWIVWHRPGRMERVASVERVEREAPPPKHPLASASVTREEIREAQKQAALPAAVTAPTGAETTLKLPGALDLVWFGQIIDDTSKGPLADARVELVAGNPFTQHTGRATTQSAADGIVQLSFDSLRPSFARVELAGYASGFVHLDSGHEQPASACPVRLLRAAKVELLVTDPSRSPCEGLNVRVSFRPYERTQGYDNDALNLAAPPFEAHTDVAGRCVIRDLPPEIPLSAELLQDTKLLRHEERTLRLEPGELRTLHWTVGGLCTLRGQALDADGRPAAGVTVLLVPDGTELLLRDVPKDAPMAQTRSGPDGRFTLDVAAGTWRVGLAPVQSGACTAKGPLTDIAPVATRVVITPEQGSAELTLICWCGLFLSGTVTGPEGEPVSSGYVSFSGEVDGIHCFANDSGMFSIGPLPPGSYELRATSDFGDLVDTEHRTVLAGTKDIEIVLHRGLSVSVRVLDARGNPVAGAVVWIFSGRDYGNRTRSRAGGEAKFENLPAQSFSISASAAGEFALERGVTPIIGGPREVELNLAPASRLRVEVLHGPEVPMQAAILLDGDPISLMFLDESPVTALATGEYEIALWGDGDEEVQRQHVRVRAEAEMRVVFDLSEGR